MSSVSERRYDTKTILFHWITLLLIVFQWGSAKLIDFFPDGVAQTTVQSSHILMGVVLAGVVLARVAWRLSGGHRLPPDRNPMLRAIAGATHLALYVLLAAIVALGLFTVWAQGDSLFGLVGVPAFDPLDPNFGDRVAGWHGFAVNLLLAVIALHAGAALCHHYVWRDGMLDRMLIRRNAD